jgi:hypothetical protein
VIATATALRDHLTELGVVLRLRGDRLVVDAPSDVFTADLKAQLVTHRDEVVALLRDDWDEEAGSEVRDAVLARIGATSPAGAFENDARLADLMEAVNVAYQRRDHDGVLDALRTLESHAMNRRRWVAS